MGAILSGLILILILIGLLKLVERMGGGMSREEHREYWSGKRHRPLFYRNSMVWSFFDKIVYGFLNSLQDGVDDHFRNYPPMEEAKKNFEDSSEQLANEMRSFFDSLPDGDEDQDDEYDYPITDIKANTIKEARDKKEAFGIKALTEKEKQLLENA